jgi:hypothetical protein
MAHWRKYRVDEYEINLTVAVEPVDCELSIFAYLDDVAVGIMHLAAPFPAVRIG